MESVIINHTDILNVNYDVHYFYILAVPSKSQTAVPKTTMSVPPTITTPSPNQQINCNFDSDLCGWIQLKGNKINSEISIK